MYDDECAQPQLSFEGKAAGREKQQIDTVSR